MISKNKSDTSNFKTSCDSSPRDRRPKVLIIITGGTICMRPRTSGGVIVSGLACAPLADYLETSIPELKDRALPEWKVVEWECLLDSSDIKHTHWQKIARQVQEEYRNFDGFVVLHGTDSLAYTSSALSFIFQNLSKPVVITGSMLPISHVHTDARKNLAVSLLVAGYSTFREVVVVFGNKILRGCRASKVECLKADAFDSPNHRPLGTIGIDIIIDSKNFESIGKPQQFDDLEIFCKIDTTAIFAISITPGFSAFLIRHIAAREERPLGIILELYGTGTAPTNDPAFVEAIQFATNNGVTIVAVTQCLSGYCSLLTYANGVILHELGVIEGKDLTQEAAVVKLAYLFGKGLSGQ